MAYLIPWARTFMYENLERIDTPNGRVYSLPNGVHVPSVTTVLDRTKDKAALKEWADRVGQAEADRQKDQAAYVGTNMHATLECILNGDPMKFGTDWMAMKGHQMAFTLANRYFKAISAITVLRLGCTTRTGTPARRTWWPRTVASWPSSTSSSQSNPNATSTSPTTSISWPPMQWHMTVCMGRRLTMPLC